MQKAKRILIYRIGNLGDTICAIPSMVAVRRRFPNAWIGLLTNKEGGNNPDSEAILKGNDFLDEIITYKPERLSDVKYIYELLRGLHQLRIDLLVYLSLSRSTRQRLIRDWVFFKSAGIKKLMGFRLPKPIKEIDQNGITLPVYPQEVDRLMQLLAPLGADVSEIEFRLPINEEDRKKVDTIWNDYQLKTKKAIVAVCPGAKFPAKRWDIDRFVKVILKLQNLYNATIVLIGGSGEIKDGRKVSATTGNSVVNIIGKTNYMQSAKVISRCNLLVSNDCGAVHLAAAVGTPVVGVYSSRDFYGAWHPWGSNHMVLRHDTVSCRYCFKTGCETMECMNSISVDQVVAACRNYLRCE